MTGRSSGSGRALAPEDLSEARGADQHQHQDRPVSRALLVIVALAVVAGLVLRFVTTSALWLDEALSVNIAALPLGDISDALRHDGHPPLYYYLLHGWMELFGTGDVAVRALSGVFAVAALPLAYVAGRRRGGATVGLIAVAVLALAPFALRYATETRMYSLVILLVFVGYLLVDDVVRRGRSDVGRLIGLVVVTAALLYTHYWTMWLLAAVGLLLVWTAWRSTEAAARRNSLRAIGALVLGGVLFVPWVPNLLYQSAHTGTPWAKASRPLAAVAAALGDFGGGGFRDAEVIGGLLLVLVLLGVFGRAVDPRHIDLDLRSVTQFRTEALLVVGTLVIGLAVSAASKGAFAPRYAAVVFPLFVLVLAGGISRFVGPGVQAGVLGAVVVLSLFGAYYNVTFARTQSDELAEGVAAHAEPGDLVVYCPDQLGPSGSRLMPDDVEQVTYPMLTAPQFVDWVDYADRNAGIDPAVVAQEVVDRSNGRPIFVVWNGGYRTFEGQCEDFVATLEALRPGGQELVASAPASNFEFGALVRFPGAS